MLSKKKKKKIHSIRVEGNHNSITRFLVPDPTLPTQSNKRNQLSQEGALESVDSIQILLALVLFGKNVQGVFASSVRDQSAYFGSLWHRNALSSLVPFDLPFDQYCAKFSSVSYM